MTVKHNTKIEWTHPPGYVGETWNPVVGCTRVSQGCVNCYAEVMAKRLRAMGLPQYAGVVNDKGRWTGQIDSVSQKGWNKPFHWTKPRCIFVNSMGDLFHERVPFTTVDMVMAMAALCTQHRFLILTKRPERMREYMTELVAGQRSMADALRALGQFRLPTLMLVADAYNAVSDDPTTLQPPYTPLENVGLGVSVESEGHTDRILTLMDTPASMRFISFEPLLGPVSGSVLNNATSRLLHWVIAGGESGPGARPCHSAWVRGLRTAAEVSGIPFFFKQWGEWAPLRRQRHFSQKGDRWLFMDGSHVDVVAGHPDALNMDADLVRRVGKRNAYRWLDSLEYSEFPLWWFGAGGP